MDTTCSLMTSTEGKSCILDEDIEKYVISRLDSYSCIILMRFVFDVYLENRRPAEITQPNQLTILSFRSVERMDRARFFFLSYCSILKTQYFTLVSCESIVIFVQGDLAHVMLISIDVCTWIYGILSV